MPMARHFTSPTGGVWQKSGSRLEVRCRNLCRDDNSQATGRRMSLERLQYSIRRRIVLMVAAFIGIAGPAQLASAQQQRGDVEVLRVRPNFYLIAGAGGNIGVQLGDNGIVLVDTGSAQMADQVLAEIKKVSDKPIRFIINNSADADHVCVNERLSKAGQNLLPGTNR